MIKRSGLLFYFLIIVLLLSISACGQATGSEAEVTETPTPTPETAQSSGSSGGADEDQQVEGTSDTTEDEDQPDEDSAGSAESTQEPTLPPTSADSCLIGTWRADRESFRQYMTQAMNVSEEAQFEFGEIEGELEMVITPELMSFRTAEPLRIPLSMTAGGMELLSLDMVIEGSGDANWVAYDNLFIVYGPDYNFFGDGLADVISTDLVGQAEVRVNMTPELLVSMATFSNVDISHVLEIYPEIENYAVATYTCEGDVFTYQFDEFEAVWLRQ